MVVQKFQKLVLFNTTKSYRRYLSLSFFYFFIIFFLTHSHRIVKSIMFWCNCIVQLISFVLITIFLHKFDTKFGENIKIYIKKINHIFFPIIFFKKYFLNNRS